MQLGLNLQILSSQLHDTLLMNLTSIWTLLNTEEAATFNSSMESLVELLDYGPHTDERTNEQGHPLNAELSSQLALNDDSIN